MEVTLQSFKKRFTYDPIKDLLGKGGFSEVYKGYDNEDKIFVALKIYTGSSDSKYNLINEVKQFKKLRHRNIIEHVEAYEVSTGSNDIHGKPIIYQIGVLEYADLGTLADLLKKGKPDYRLVEKLSRDIIDGLAYLHQQGITHRDLKPSNILLFSDGENIRAKITDFGIAKRLDATASSTQLVGTVEYMAPEFFTTGKITPASDVWSLGVMLYEALTGEHLFGKTTQGLSNEQIINNILNKDISRSAENIPAPLNKIISECLTREPNLRAKFDTEIGNYLLATDKNTFSEKTQFISQPNSQKDQATKPISYKKFTIGFIVILLIGGGIYILQKFKTYNQVIVPVYNSAGYYGFKDAKTGTMVIPLKFDYADSFYENKAKVLINGHFGFIGINGDTIIKGIYDDAGRFNDGMALIAMTKGVQKVWGYLDNNGNEVIPPQYITAHPFENGLAEISPKGWWDGEGVINKSGVEVIPVAPQLIQRIRDFIIGIQYQGSSVKKIVYNRSGQELSWLNKYPDFYCDDEANLIMINELGYFSWLNQNGDEVIKKIKCETAFQFREGLAGVKGNDGYYFINTMGKRVFSVKNTYLVNDFHQGLALFVDTLSGRCGYLDKSGKEVIPLRYADANDFYKGLARVRLSQKKWGCINGKGNLVIPCIYDELSKPDEYGRVVAKKDGLYGVLDTTGDIIVPFKYECYANFGAFDNNIEDWDKRTISDFKHGLYLFRRDGKPLVMDYKGNNVLELNETARIDMNRLGLEIRDDELISVFYNGKEVLWYNRTGREVKKFE